MGDPVAACCGVLEIVGVAVVLLLSLLLRLVVRILVILLML